MKLGERLKNFWNEKNAIIKSVLSVCVTVLTLTIAITSMVIAKQALKVSEIALKTNSSVAEPILDFDIDWNNDKITVVHETSDIFQIKYVTFGLVRTIAVMDNNSDNISSVELQEKEIGLNLEHGHTVGTDCSDEDAEKYNKKFELQLGDIEENTERLDLLEEKVRTEWDENDCFYWEVSPHFNYRYIVVEYTDIYGNRRSQYYIYKYEYSTAWRFYKLSEEEFEKYVELVEDNFEETEVMKRLFEQTNFKMGKETKYHNFSEWNNLDQFKLKNNNHQ